MKHLLMSSTSRANSLRKHSARKPDFGLLNALHEGNKDRKATTTETKALHLSERWQQHALESTLLLLPPWEYTLSVIIPSHSFPRFCPRTNPQLLPFATNWTSTSPLCSRSFFQFHCVCPLWTKSARLPYFLVSSWAEPNGSSWR